MQFLRWRLLLTIFLTMLLGGVSLALIGSERTLLVLCVFLLALLGWQVMQIRRLWQALDAQSGGDIPSAPGIWGEVFYRLQRFVRRWHDQVQRVETQHRRFIEAIQASPNGVVMLDDQDRIVWCNGVAERHLGVNARRDLLQRINYLVRDPAFVRYLHAGRFEDELTLRGIGPSRQAVISVQIFPYGEDQKLMLSHDITQMENTDAMRRDFVANVSHELKTPLTVLSGFLETVRELPLDQATHSKYLEMMHVQARRMEVLVRDLLTLANLEGNAFPPPETALDVGELLERLHHEAEVLSAGRHTLQLECEPGWQVTGDENELFSAFSNLVSNAISYTDAGGHVAIGWKVTRDAAGDVVSGAFYVRDTGSGIAAEHIPRLTERFYRVDRSRSRETGGTGLGLAIVKHVLSRHGAELLIESTMGRGSTFTAAFSGARVRR